jgi:hypothetical protein
VRYLDIGSGILGWLLLFEKQLDRKIDTIASEIVVEIVHVLILYTSNAIGSETPKK